MSRKGGQIVHLYKRKDSPNWYIYYRKDGKRIRKSVGPDREIAEAVRNKIEQELLMERFLGIPQAVHRETTLGQLAERYIQYAYQHKRSADRDEYIIRRHLLPFFGPRTFIKELTQASVEAYKASRLHDGVKPRTVNYELAVLRAMLNRAVDWGLLQYNHLKFKMLPGEVKRERFLSKEEEERLLEACRESPNPYLEAFVVVALYTGLRHREIASLTWEDVDLKAKRIRVVDAKNRTVRYQPLPQKAVEAFRSLPRREGNIFPYWLNKAFKKACERAGIEDLRIHDLRHTYASRLVQAGVPLRIVQELLGHASISTTMRYAHLAYEHLAEAVSVLDMSPECPQGALDNKTSKN